MRGLSIMLHVVYARLPAGDLATKTSTTTSSDSVINDMFKYLFQKLFNFYNELITKSTLILWVLICKG